MPCGFARTDEPPPLIRDGTLELVHDALRREARAAEKPSAPRAAASADSRSVDTTPGGADRGRDNAKNVDGRKRHILVDPTGFSLAVPVTAARGDDAKASPELFARLGNQPVSRVRRAFAGGKCHDHDLIDRVEGDARWRLGVARRPEGVQGRVLVPERWVVGRTLAWLGKCRRLSEDRERSVGSPEAFIRLAVVQLVLNRLAPKGGGPEFHYDLAI